LYFKLLNAILLAKHLVRIGAFTNIQDETVITEAAEPLGVDHDGSTIVGNYVTVGAYNLLQNNELTFATGHRCVLRGCTVENLCIVGMGSVLNEGSYMERESILGAGSVLMANARVPKHQVGIH